MYYLEGNEIRIKVKISRRSKIKIVKIPKHKY